MNNWITTSDFIKYNPYNIYAEDVGFESPSDSGLENYHTLFRKKFTLGKKADAKYLLNITADDNYKLYINGVLVAIGPANGYHAKYNFNELNVSEYLKNDDNIIATHVYYHGKIDFAHVSMDNRQGMWAELVEDGKCILKTDDTWKYFVDKSYNSNGVRWGYDTQFAENIDRRTHPKGWKSLEFDDSNWHDSVVRLNDDHKLHKQITPTVCFYEQTKKNVTKLDKKTWLLDFGKETVGYVRLYVNSRNGGSVRIKCGEELLENGCVRSEMRCGVNFDEVWTYDAGEDIIESYDYSGFRYLQFETEDEDIKPENFTVLVRHYPVGYERKFKSDNALLQKIWDICKNAVKISTQEGYFDCPTREKGQYLGDLLITALSHFYLYKDARIYKKALYDFADSMDVVPGINSTAPSGIKNCIVDYTFLYPLIILNYYNISNDLDTVKELIPYAEKSLSYFSKYEREDGLLDGVPEWNLVDWPENLRDNYEFDLSRPTKNGVHNVINAYYYGAKKMMNELYWLCGIDKEYETEALKKAYFDAFYNPKTGFFTDAEKGNHSALHSNVIPYFYGMTTPEQEKKMPDFIMKKGFSCGVYFSYFVLKSLTMHGEKEKAMELMLNKSEHSWYNMIKEGATSSFEAWGKAQKSNSSLCHPWASSPIIILCEDFPEL